MRYLIPLLLFLATAAVAEPYFVTTGGIDDHGFDEELVSDNFPDWTFSGSGSFIREEYREYDSKSYAVIETSTSGDNYFYQDLLPGDLIVGRTYILSFRYKILDDDLTVSTGGGAKVELAINEGPLSGTVFAATKPVTEETGDNWGMARVAFTARAEDCRLSVGMWDSTGTLCIDDVRINIMDESVGGTLVNPDFEPLGTVGPAPFGWTATPGPNGIITTVNDGIISGSGAADITQTGIGDSILTQTITIDQMTRYRGYVYLYTDGLTGSGAAFKVIQIKPLGTETLFETDTYTGDNAWRRVPIDFTTIDEGTTVTFEIKQGGAGTTRCDGLYVRKMPIMAGDFEDDNWDNYWEDDPASNGASDRVLAPGSLDNHVLEIENSGNSDITTVYQDFAPIEGLSYMFSGRVYLDNLASIRDDKYGAYVKLIDNETDEILDVAGPFTDEEEWITFGLHCYEDPVETPTVSERYKLQLILDEASGTMLVDDVEVYSEAIHDVVTVVPQPASVNRHGTYGRIGDGTWYIVYDDLASPVEPTRDDPSFRCADDVRNDLIFDEDVHPNYFHYFGVDEDITLVKLSDYNEGTHKPSLLILNPANSSISDIMERHGITAKEVVALGDEGYYLSTGYNGGDEEVLILATTAKGRYYGTQTFLQLLQHPKFIGENTVKVYQYPDVTIYDTPELPIRAIHIPLAIDYRLKPGDTGFDITKYKYEYNPYMFQWRYSEDEQGEPNRTPLTAYIRMLSRMKINMLVIQSPLFYCLDYTGKYIDVDRNGTPESSNLDVMSELFKYCRKYYIEPVPLMQSLGHGKEVLQFEWKDEEEDITYRNWLEVEACWVGDPDGYEEDDIPLPQLLETFTESTHTLEHPYVIKTSARPITVYELDEDGEIVGDPLLPDTDYTVSYVNMSFDINRGYIFTEKIIPPEGLNCTLNITKNLPKWYEWAVEYHFINPPRGETDVAGKIQFSYCPTSTAIQKFMETRIEKVVEELQPRYIHFGHDEPWQMHTCERCQNLPTLPPPGVTEPGRLFGEDVNRLVGYYEDATIAEIGSASFNTGQRNGFYRTLIWADHVSYPHEDAKVPDQPLFATTWWRYRGVDWSEGNPQPWVSTCKEVIEKSVIANDWNYFTDDDQPTNKYLYIQDLTDSGFDVIGADAGYANFDYEDSPNVDPWGGATIYARLWYPKGGQDTAFDIWLSGFEGTMKTLLPLNKHTINGNKHYAQGDDGKYWFNRNIGGDYHEPKINIKDMDAGEHVNEVYSHVDMRGKSTQGKAWFDNIELGFSDESTADWDILVNENTNNGDFGDPDAGPYTFEYWDDTSLFRAECYADSNLRFGSVGDYAMRYEVNQINTEDVEDPVENETDISGIHGTIDPADGVEPEDKMRLAGFTRTYEVDTLRLGCPKQWRSGGAHFEYGADTSGLYIGGMKASWGVYCFPLDEITKVHWKKHATDVGVADWNWTKRYPATPYLKNITWDPFVMYFKEVPW